MNFVCPHKSVRRKSGEVIESIQKKSNKINSNPIELILSKTRQHRTRQDKTTQDKTRQDKTKAIEPRNTNRFSLLLP